MTLTTTFRRPLVAAIALAAGAAIALTGCSSDDSKSDSTPSTSASTTASAADNANTGELTVDSAQVVLRKALDAKTSEADLDGLVEFTTPETKSTLIAYNKKAGASGYGPEVYTVKKVAPTGDTAAVTVAIKSPHAPAPIDIPFSFVKVDGNWKLSAKSVEMLTSMMSQYSR